MIYNLNLISQSQEDSYKAIVEYHTLVTRMAEERVTKVSNTVSQHTIPQFILKQIGSEGPPYGSSKGVSLKQQNIIFNKNKKPKITWEKSKGDISPRIYSVYEDIYTSKYFMHPYLLEVLFSIVEGDAAKLIRSRLNDNLEFVKNPYYFKNNDNRLKAKTQQRAAISTFLAIQMLRSNEKQEFIKSMVEKHYAVQVDFGASIASLLVPLSLEIYEKQWGWIRLLEDDLFISELGISSSSSCDKKASQLMVLSRHDLLYVSEKQGSFYELHDKIILSKSMLLNDWIRKILLDSVIGNWNPSGDFKLSFLSHKEAELENKFFRTKMCCFPHFSDPFMLAEETAPIFASDDYLKE